MKIFRHSTHTVYEIQEWKLNGKNGKRQHGICIIHETGNRFNARSLWNPRCWKLIVTPHKSSRWFWFVHLPVFRFNRDNCNLEIGHPNLYLWIIR